MTISDSDKIEAILRALTAGGNGRLATIEAELKHLGGEIARIGDSIGHACDTMEAQGTRLTRLETWHDTDAKRMDGLSEHVDKVDGRTKWAEIGASFLAILAGAVALWKQP